MTRIFSHCKAALTLTLTPILLISLIICSCARKADTSQTVMTDRPTVTVSLAPHAWITEQIAGDRMNVAVLMPSGGNPETYDPSIADMRRLTSSRLYLMAGGMEFEPRVASRLPEGTEAVDLSRGIKLIYGTHSHGHDADSHHDQSHHDHDGEMADPHTWSSLRGGRKIAENIAAALISVDPDGKGYYTSRLNSLTQRLDSLDAHYSRIFTATPEGNTFLIWHPSLSYLARDYGLTQQALGAEHKEHSVKSLRSLLDAAGQARPAVMFLQPETDNRTARATAEQLGVRVVTINPLNPDWLGEITHTLDALTDPQP